MSRRFDVKAAREEMGLSRRQLARKIPVSLATIQRHESPTNTRDLSQMAQGHIERLLQEHRKAQKGHDKPRPNASARSASPSQKSNGMGPTRRPLPDTPSSSAPVVRAFGRVVSE